MSQAHITPSFRYGLKARIIEAGYRSMTEFASQIQVTDGRISRILNGWELPSPDVQKRITKRLSITLRELQTLL